MTLQNSIAGLPSVQLTNPGLLCSPAQASSTSSTAVHLVLEPQKETLVKSRMPRWISGQNSESALPANGVTTWLCSDHQLRAHDDTICMTAPLHSLSLSPSASHGILIKDRTSLPHSPTLDYSGIWKPSKSLFPSPNAKSFLPEYQHSSRHSPALWRKL